MFCGSVGNSGNPRKTRAALLLDEMGSYSSKSREKKYSPHNFNFAGSSLRFKSSTKNSLTPNSAKRLELEYNHLSEDRTQSRSILANSSAQNTKKKQNYSSKRTSSKANSPNTLSNKRKHSKEKRSHKQALYSRYMRSLELKDGQGIEEGRLDLPSIPIGVDSFKLVLQTGSILLELFKSLGTKTDIYDSVKDYVELCQNPVFTSLEEELKGGYGFDISRSMKIERWIVLFFFYFSFNKSKMKKIKSLLLFLSKKLLENYYCSLSSYQVDKKCPSELKSAKKLIEDELRKSRLEMRGLQAQRESVLVKNLVEMKKLLGIW